MKRTTITPRDQEILSYIVAFKSTHDGNSPSIRQICDACGDAHGPVSTSVVRYCLARLERLGKIERHGEVGDSRMICVIGGRWLPPTHLKVKISFAEQQRRDAKKLLKVVTN